MLGQLLARGQVLYASRRLGALAPGGAPSRVVRTRMGRNDGASGGKRAKRPDKRRWYPEQPAPQGEEGGPGPSGRSVEGSMASPARRPGRPSRRQAQGEDEDEDARGWWERPEERSLQAFAAPPLQAWQEARLELAYATGRRKAQVQELARELDVDRSQVIAWFKEFTLKPEGERNAILVARRAEPEAQRAKEAARSAVEAATGQDEAAHRLAARAAQQQRPGSAPQQEPTGFIPFYLRKQLGADKQKRISGEALRTLESIYDRTPYPSADVVKGVHELHKIQRDVVMTWFAARREADGILSSTQKRVGRTNREKDRNFEGAFNGEPSEMDDEQELQAIRGNRAGKSREPPGDSSLMSLMADVAPGGAPAADAMPVVVPMTKREMAALRSSMPSPTKFKGMKLAEQMGIKTGAGEAMTQIGNVQYVADDEDAAQKLRKSWRYKAATQPSGNRRLRLRGGAKADGKADGTNP